MGAAADKSQNSPANAVAQGQDAPLETHAKLPHMLGKTNTFVRILRVHFDFLLKRIAPFAKVRMFQLKKKQKKRSPETNASKNELLLVSDN